MKTVPALLLLCSAALGEVVPGGRTIDIDIADAVYDRASGRIYALTRSGNLARIDSGKATVEQSAPLPLATQSIVLGENGRKLYALVTAFPSTVFRIDAVSLAVEQQYSLDTANIPNCFCRVTQVLPVEGQEQAFVALISSGTRLERVAVFDGEQPRPKIVDKDPALFDISTLVAGPAPDLVYGYNGVTDRWGLTRLRITGEGIEKEGKPLISPSGFNRPLVVSRNLLYAANGSVLDIERDEYAGRINDGDVIFASAFAIDEEANRIYYATRSLGGTSYKSFDLKTLLPVAGVRVENKDARDLAMPFAPKRMLVTREGDLVVFDGQESRLLFLPTAALRDYDPYALPSLKRITPHLSYLPAPAAFLAADRANERLYFTMHGHIPGSGNTVVALDPKTGWMSEPVFAGSDPGPLAVSARGRFVYVTAQGERVVRRLSVPGLETELKLRPKSVGLLTTGRPATAVQILPLPENDESVVLIQGSLSGPDVEGYNGTTVYDNALRRPRFAAADFEGNITSAALSADGTRLYALEGSISSFEFSQVRIQPDGALLEKVTPAIGSALHETLSCDDWLCATSAGTVLEATRPRRLARLPGAGSVIADQARGTVFVLRASGAASMLVEYDVRTAQPVRQMALPMSGPFWCFVRWADDQFAALSNDGLWLISAAGMTEPPAVPVPRVTTNTTGLTVNLPATSLAYDRSRKLLYIAVPASAGAYGNLIVALDPTTGAVVKTIAVGSGPALLRVTDDGKYLYAGLQTANAVARIELAEWKLDTTIPMPGSPATLSVRPGHSRSFAVSLGPGPLVGYSSTAPYERGLWLFEDERRLPAPAFRDTGVSWSLFVNENTLAAESQIVRITASGLAEEPRRVPVFTARVAAGGRLFGEGSSYDAASLERLHRLNESGAELPVPDQNRIYYLHLAYDRSKSLEIRVYDWTTLRVIGTIPFRRDDQPSELVACGSDCIAVRSLSGISIVRTAAIEFVANDRPAAREGDGWRMPLRLNRLLFDARRNRLLATTTPDNGQHGNSLLTIRPTDGAIEQTVWLGSDPAPMALSQDGTRVYVGLLGERALVETNPEAGTSRKIARIAPRTLDEDFAPQGLAFRPGTPEGLAVSLRAPSRASRVVMYEGANQLPGIAEGVFDNPGGEDVYFSADGSRVQVVGTPSTGAGWGGATWSLPVTSGGVFWAPRVSWLSGRIIARCGGRLYDTSGTYFNSETFNRLGSIEISKNSSGSIEGVACDEQKDRVHYMVWNSTILTYRLSTSEFLGATQTPSRGGMVWRMVSAGDAGVAYWISEDNLGSGQRLADELIVVRTPWRHARDLL